MGVGRTGGERERRGGWLQRGEWPPSGGVGEKVGERRATRLLDCWPAVTLTRRIHPTRGSAQDLDGRTHGTTSPSCMPRTSKKRGAGRARAKAEFRIGTKSPGALAEGRKGQRTDGEK